MTKIDPNADPVYPDTLEGSINRLADNAVTLAGKVDIAARLSRRVAVLVVAVFLIVLAGGAISAVQWDRISKATDGNKDNAVQSCENANETRAANLSLWQYVFTLSAQKPDASPEEVELVRKFKAWVEVLYQPHDCNDLGRVYKVPPPPT